MALYPLADPQRALNAYDDGTLRTFPGGATRDTAEGKLEPWGFQSALVEKVFCEYMNEHRIQSDGNLRDSDNWKSGFGLDSCFHSLSRHILDLRLLWEGYESQARTDSITDALCAIRFNVDALLLELTRKRVEV